MNKPYDYVASFRAQQSGLTRWSYLAFPDVYLLIVIASLMAIGVVMVASSSLTMGSSGVANFYFFKRQLLFYFLGILAIFFVFTYTSSRFYFDKAYQFLFLAFLCVFLVHVPILGYSSNGAKRWLNLSWFTLHTGEVAKLCFVVFMAHFLTKYQVAFRRKFKLSFFLLSWLFALSLLLLLQPDYGTVVVIAATVFCMMFIAGAPILHFVLYVATAMLALFALALFTPYRLRRLMAFSDPFRYATDEGYQLVQSLIAIGRGQWSGVGLGESVFKHEFLPEAHTDFIFAIISEELGFYGALFVMVLFFILVVRAFRIAHLAARARNLFASYVAYGIGFMFAIQVLINFGVVNGSLPTKGLTLPLISYGGSSVIISCVALGILLRIDSESRFIVRREKGERS